MNKVLKAISKEIGRWLVLAVLPATIGYLTELGGEFALYATMVLRLVDRLIHVAGQEMKSESLEKGLVRF